MLWPNFSAFSEHRQKRSNTGKYVLIGQWNKFQLNAHERPLTLKQLSEVRLGLVQRRLSIPITYTHLGPTGHQVLGKRQHRSDDESTVGATAKLYRAFTPRRGRRRGVCAVPLPPRLGPRSRRSGVACFRARWPYWGQLCTESAVQQSKVFGVNNTRTSSSGCISQCFCLCQSVFVCVSLLVRVYLSHDVSVSVTGSKV